MSTRDEDEKAPAWGDTPEFRAYCAARHVQDPKFTTLPNLVHPELVAAKKEGVEAFAKYLNALSGVGTFAVKGTVYVPKRTRAFGDWLLLPNDRDPEIVDKEEIETQDDFPYVYGKIAYTVRSACAQRDRGVMVVAEEFAEDGRPRVMYPNELERFDIYHVNVTDILEEREKRHEIGALRFLGLLE